MAGAVAAGGPQTCEAALQAFAAGGNGFDAVLAAGFAACVCEPTLASLGGGGFLLARSAGGRALLCDFFANTPGLGGPAREPGAGRGADFWPVTVRFPGSQQIFNVGPAAAAAPGALRGLLHVHRRFGRIPLREVLAPAQRLAREGFALSESQSYFLRLLRPIFTMRAEGRALFAPGGALPTAGETLRNPALADFLASLPEDGDREFYEGAIAARIAADLAAEGGLLTQRDFAVFRTVERAPLRQRYRGFELLTNPAPAFGGRLLAASLRALEAAGAPECPRGHALALLKAMQQVAAQRQQILHSAPGFSRGTTHVSVLDSEGAAASLTLSNGEGCGYFVPGTGVHLNNMMGEEDLHPGGFHTAAPGQRVASMMSPSLLLRGGETALVLGSAGSNRIAGALLQVLSQVVDFGRSVSAAVAHPRLHWDGAAVQVEPGLPEAVLAALRERAPLNPWRRSDVYFGGVNAVAPGGQGAGDPRRGGCFRRTG
ncbi:MAG: gamma-glutamyltransferase [Deltaproteobacteria bacterium]|nr:gamma-glutamyltransferase [Deltaproteobacteria bacterium]